MKSFLNKTLETSINHFLALDPESERRLAALEGKSITMKLQGILIELNLKIVKGKMIIESDSFEHPDVVITGTPLNLMQMSLSSDRRKFFAEDISIEGNLELGQQIIDLFDEMQIDWEEHFSKLVGDIPAHQVGRFVRRIKHFTQRTHENFLQTMNEYVHEEVSLFPPREELQDFFDDVDHVRLEADRLEARVQRLLNFKEELP